MSDSDDRVRYLIAQAAVRREANKARRQRLNTARQYGLAARHHLKLTRGTTEPEPPDTAR